MIAIFQLGERSQTRAALKGHDRTAAGVRLCELAEVEKPARLG